MFCRKCLLLRKKREKIASRWIKRAARCVPATTMPRQKARTNDLLGTPNNNTTAAASPSAPKPEPPAAPSDPSSCSVVEKAIAECLHHLAEDDKVLIREAAQFRLRAHALSSQQDLELNRCNVLFGLDVANYRCLDEAAVAERLRSVLRKTEDFLKACNNTGHMGHPSSALSRSEAPPPSAPTSKS